METEEETNQRVIPLNEASNPENKKGNPFAQQLDLVERWELLLRGQNGSRLGGDRGGLEGSLHRR